MRNYRNMFIKKTSVCNAYIHVTLAFYYDYFYLVIKEMCIRDRDRNVHKK